MTYEQLEKHYQNGRAALPIDRINHREFIFEGRRYFAGYDSMRDLNYKPKSEQDAPYKVRGWLIYKHEMVT